VPALHQAPPCITLSMHPAASRNHLLPFPHFSRAGSNTGSLARISLLHATFSSTQHSPLRGNPSRSPQPVRLIAAEFATPKSSLDPPNRSQERRSNPDSPASKGE